MINRIINGKLQRIMQAGFILSALFGFFGCGSNGDVPLFQTADWIDSRHYDMNVALRRESQAGGALLLKLESKPELIKRYDPSTKTLSSAASESWEAATGDVARCEKQFAPFGRLDFDPDSNRLVDADKTAVPTKGRHVMRLVESPSGTRVAVLSADGYRPNGIFPIGGGAGTSGQHWHQVYSLSERRMETDAARIPLEKRFVNLEACWSADEKFVVYYDPIFSFLSIVHNN